jgi:activator of HSP90 ATPase
MRSAAVSKLGTNGTTRRQIIMAGAMACGGLSVRAAIAAETPEIGVSHSAESIHQEPIIAASRTRIYAALTDARQFDRLTQFSEAMKSMTLKPKPADIDKQPGGAFALFGGYITGRFIEIAADELIVQAWRVGNWNPGVYSIARFQLGAEGGATRIVFDHTGFPPGAAEHLAEGWHGNYWEPLRKLLS